MCIRDRCCSYEAHVLLGNMGNIDWRPVLNLWAVVEYVTKYAAKAPKGSRKIREVLDDAVEEVCKYVPEGEHVDLVRKAIQKFFARMRAERDYHCYEVAVLGLRLPLLLPMMPVIGLNTTGARAVKSGAALRGKGDDEPVHWDSKVDKFDKRLQIVRGQRAKGDDRITEEEGRDVSLFEFWWKYAVRGSKIQRSSNAVCLQVTPSYSAECANVEHACHDAYARATVIAYWRHMPTRERREMIRAEMCRDVRPVPEVCIGGTEFEAPFVRAGAVEGEGERYLGVQDLWCKSGVGLGGVASERYWGRMLMEMLTDLRGW